MGSQKIYRGWHFFVARVIATANCDQNFSVVFHKKDAYTHPIQRAPGSSKPKNFDAEFSLIGIDAAIANAFRRILIAEVPTLAIEDVFIFNNTSIIQDEVLAHRLGLIPLTGNPDGLNWLLWRKKEVKDESDDSAIPTELNTVVLNLNIDCTWKEDGRQLARRGEADPQKLYNHSNVYAKDMVFQAQGRQNEIFSEKNGKIEPVNPDILIAKLRPGQSINLQMHCVKGVGADHAKFSPVCTASYRLLPSINIISPIVGADARKFARCFPKGVIGLEPASRAEIEQAGGKEGDSKAVVLDPMKDTVSRECLRHAEFKDKVKLGRVRDHFIFRVESTGQFESDELFLESVRLLKAKCKLVKKGLENMHRG